MESKLIRASIAVAALTLAPFGSAVAGLSDESLNLAFETTVAERAELVPDAHLAELRGGVGGVKFSVYFAGEMDRATSNGSIPEGMTVDTSQNDSVQITSGLGNFGGANGVFQLTEVNGSMNVINNTMVVNVAIVNDPGRIDMASLFPAGGFAQR